MTATPTPDFQALEEALKPTSEHTSQLPDDKDMIQAGLTILKYSPTGAALVKLVSQEKLRIQILRNKTETVFLPNSREIYLGIQVNGPTPPTRFVLLLAAALREAEQELMGINQPDIDKDADEYAAISLSKHADKVSYMCEIAYQLNETDGFTEYKFLDEIRKMGHNESRDIYLKNV